AVGPVLIAWLDQSALQNLRAPITALERPVEKRVPAIGRKSDLPIVRDPAIDPTLLQILSGRRADFSFDQILVKPFRGFGVKLKQRAPRLVLAIILAARPAFFDHGNARTRRDLTH